MGKKYIIELEEPEMFDERKFYTCSQMPWWAVSENIVENLTPYTEPDTEKVREEAYQQGLSDAWEAARKIVCRISDGGYTQDLLDSIFGSHNYQSIMAQYSASDAVEKISKYKPEQKQEEEQIQVGDEVWNIKDGWIAVVSNIDGECMTLMDTNGALGDGYDVNRFTKTGRHFPEIAAVLAKMKEEP